MLIRVVDGTYNPDGTVDRDDTLEPRGREIWKAKVEDLTAAALHAAGTRVDPGTWYELKQFKELVDAANSTDDSKVFNTVSTTQSGVSRSWTAMIEVADSVAALMVCRSLIEHIEQRERASDIWIRIE